MRNSVIPIYGSILNLPQAARDMASARFLVGILPELAPLKGLTNEDFVYLRRIQLHRALQTLLRAFNQTRLSFPFLLPGRSQISLIRPVLGLIQADIVGARDLFCTHSHFSIRCGIRSYIPSGSHDNVAGGGDEDNEDDGGDDVPAAATVCMLLPNAKVRFCSLEEGKCIVHDGYGPCSAGCLTV
jgi:hypothetical protein